MTGTSEGVGLRVEPSLLQQVLSDGRLKAGRAASRILDAHTRRPDQKGIERGKAKNPECVLSLGTFLEFF